MKKIIGFSLLFYVLFLVQMSFLPTLFPRGFIPSVVIGMLVFLLFFGNLEFRGKVWYILFAGFLLDIGSSSPFGFWGILLGGGFLLITIITKNYVRFPFLKRM